MTSNQNRLSKKVVSLLSLSSVLVITGLGNLPYAVEAKPLETPSQGLKQAQQKKIIHVNSRQGVDTPGAGYDASRPFRSITYALKQAAPGTVIALSPGQYTGEDETFPLKIPAGVTLKGNQANQGSGIEIIGGGDTITKTYGLQNMAIIAEGNSQIIGVTVSNPNVRGTGVWLEENSALVSYSTFTKNHREGVFVSGNASPIIENNKFVNNDGNGLALGRQAKGQIRKNIFENTGFGIAMGGDAAPYLSDNQIQNNDAGIILTENARPTLMNNVIVNNSRFGIVASSKAKPNLQGNNQILNNGEDMLIAGKKVAKPTSTNVSKPPLPSTPASLPPNQPTQVSANSNSYSSQVKFQCVQVANGYATIVKRNDPAVIPKRMISWQRQVGSDWTPEARCEVVTGRLNRLVADNGGQISNLVFTIGSVDGYKVVCLASNSSFGCNNSNMLFTLSSQNARNTRGVLQSLADSLDSGVGGQSTPVQESASGEFVSLDTLEQQLQPDPALWFVN